MVPYVPSWAFGLPWVEAMVPTGPSGDAVWLRKVGQEPTNGFLGIGKKGAAEYVCMVVNTLASAPIRHLLVSTTC